MSLFRALSAFSVAFVIGLSFGVSVRATQHDADDVPRSDDVTVDRVEADSAPPRRRLRIEVALAAPRPETHQPVFPGADVTLDAADLARKDRTLAHVTAHLAPLFDRPGSGRVKGRARAGALLTVEPTDDTCGAGDDVGVWLKTPEGYACSAFGFDVGPATAMLSRQSSLPRAERPPPNTARPLPHRYAKVSVRGEPLFDTLPSKGELDAAHEALATSASDDGKPLPGPVRERSDGAYWLALDREVDVDGHTLWKTVGGDYVDASRLDHRPMPRMRGEDLKDGPLALPIAFPFQPDGAAAECPRPRGWTVCGHVQKHARFHVANDDGTFVYSDDGWRVPRSAVRVATETAPPADLEAADIARGLKWVHIDLDEQTLTAYEGKRPVYVTLVSTGKGESHQTPTGLYRVKRKYLTKTMRGPDDDVGRYHIEEIPWVMYYRGGYAVHAAYWHDTFGNTRSHGCTNVPPADARWLYHWSSPEVPDHWHAALTRTTGTWLYFSKENG